MSEEKTTHANDPVPQAVQTGPNGATHWSFSRIWLVILYGFVAIAFTALWLWIYGWLDRTIWSNDFVLSHTWTIPVGVVFFSLLVGLSQKYLRAPTVIHGGFTELLRVGGHAKTDSSTFAGALLSSYCSLLSGASVGPEGPLAFLIQDITTWLNEKLKVAEDAPFGLSIAALASAFNGIVGSPVFTAVFATEFQVGGKELSYAFLAWNLLAGAIGYLFFTLLKLPVFAQYIPFTPINTLTLPYVLYAILLGLVGSLLAIFIGGCFQFFGTVMDKIRRQGRPANPGSRGGHSRCRLFCPGGDVRWRAPDLPDDQQSSALRRVAVAALCTAEDPAAGPFIQEWLSGRPDIPDLVCLNDGRTSSACTVPDRSPIHPRVVH